MYISPSSYHAVRNKLLRQIGEPEFQALQASLTRVRLVTGQLLIEHGQTTEHAFFLEEGLASVVADTEMPGTGVQVAMIGAEGVIGAMQLLQEEQGAFGFVVVHSPGTAWRLPMAELQRQVWAGSRLREACVGFLQDLVRQTMQTAASNARNTLAARCVRWLLLAHDRVEGDELFITHEALSVMLGVRRSGVTVVVSGLQEEGLVSVGRGRIRILDRPGLERKAGSSSWFNPTAPLPHRGSANGRSVSADRPSNVLLGPSRLSVGSVWERPS